MNDPACRSCKHWEGGVQGDPAHGLCRLLPPQLREAVVEARHNPASGLWPETGAEDFCGHYAARRLEAPAGDTRPGASNVTVDQQRGIITVWHHNGDTLELTALEGLTEQDAAVLQRMVWNEAQ